MTIKYRLVLVRHGQSLWNLENRFTGWTNIPLTNVGKLEASFAGEVLNKNNIVFDKCHTSVLRRAIQTWNIVSEITNLMHIPVDKHWRLNERH
mmetsp:Transcript_26658/g.58673  ORF Transcript_26658/g.58673 Transcript_26658/m.58673 type:complete len:93 (+) Transcript_26658:7-285(+)